MKLRWIAALLALGAAMPAHATAVPSIPVTASRPEGVVNALRSLGYTAELTADDAGEPLINARIGTYQAFVLFYDCDERMHDNCQSLQFTASFTPEKPFGPQEAAAFSRNYRFGAVTIGTDKSVVLSWDVVTGNGIDSSVFQRVVENFSYAMDNIGSLAFKDEPRPAGRLMASARPAGS